MIADSKSEVAERRETWRAEAALRRIATLVARGVQPDVFFSVVAEEVGRVVDAPSVGVVRYEPGDTVTVCGVFPPQEPLFRTGTRLSLLGASVLGLLREHAEPARIDNYDELAGEIADAVRSRGLRSSVGVPIVVAGQVWGAIVASSTERLPESTGAQLAAFTQLVATAIANTESRTEVIEQLADEQAALRRVATLVAKEDPPVRAVCESRRRNRPVVRRSRVHALAQRTRWERPRTSEPGARRSPPTSPSGRVFRPDGDGVATTVLRTGRPHRIDDYSAVTDPIASECARSGD